MKLRNKKSGEIKEVIVGGYPVSGKTKIWECSEMDANEETGYKTLGTYTSLAELNEEWEDYEEPKDYYVINLWGEVSVEGGKYQRPGLSELGLTFETKEEAEKAVEKLKAFANLRKRGLKFNGWDEADRGMVGEFAIYCDVLELDGIERELEIVFGREEL